MISIVIPAFNEEKTIEKTVRQFAGLSVPHEVIVCDDHSTDRTVAIAKLCADTVIEAGPNDRPGVSNRRNKGANAAKGDFIVFLDSGDAIPDMEHFFSNTLSFFQNNPNLAGLSVRIEVDHDVRRLSDWIVFGMMNGWFAILNNVFHFGIAAGKFQMVHASAFRKVGGFNEHMPAGEDVDFFRRLSKIGRTHIAWSLAVFHSGRRLHQLGAWTTLYRWIKNALSVWIYKKSADSGWQPIR
jgi:glycosyltransferase involved in cell wall biosynthesis